LNARSAGAAREAAGTALDLGRTVVLAVVLALVFAAPPAADSATTVTLRGKTQRLHLYGPATGPPVLVASGDGGWIHLGVSVAEILAGRGFSVAGLDSRAYLSSFTGGGRTLQPADVVADFRSLVDFVRQGRPAPVLLVGVSEGAGLCVLAASDPGLQPSLGGVVALGLPELNELGWRFRDSIIYVTKKTPDEPLFRASEYLPRLGPVPLAAMYSTHDEFVPMEEARRLMGAPAPRRRVWVIPASDHRFSDAVPELQARLQEAIEWLAAQAPSISPPSPAGRP
jgi:pimeloyl-ACP methyl ester carboxylesterase